jgi:hypothetical protein
MSKQRKENKPVYLKDWSKLNEIEEPSFFHSTKENNNEKS